jgi:hypothetical protein
MPASEQAAIAPSATAEHHLQFCNIQNTFLHLTYRSPLFWELRMAVVDLTGGVLTTISSFIAAAGALGTTAYGLVDACKAFRGGVSNVGFKSIRNVVNRHCPPKL